jgi:hypothetical protein
MSVRQTKDVFKSHRVEQVRMAPRRRITHRTLTRLASCKTWPGREPLILIKHYPVGAEEILRAPGEQ